MGGCHLATVDAELAGETKFSELVANHLLRDVHGDEVLAVVDCECETHKLGGGISELRAHVFYNALIAGLDHFHDLFKEFLINVGAFFG